LISGESARLRAFVRQHQDVILKPLDSMGGDSIFRVTPDDPNLSVILETITRHESRTVMAQRFIPEIRDGDKRILVIDGEPVDYCLARIPMAGETRGNLAAGGRGEARPLTARDREIVAAVGPELQRRGILFAGLDVIGDYLTEVNVTSPTCFREIMDQTGINVAGLYLDALERRCAH
jgi:glutathione synthase